MRLFTAGVVGSPSVDILGSMRQTPPSLRCFFRSSRSSVVATVIAFVALTALCCAPRALAQHTDKMVQGKVENASGAPLTKAIVYLKNTQSLDVKSYITEADGVYRFGQISSNADYKLWAELQGSKSAVKTISSFDDKRHLFVNLHIDTAK